MLTFLSYLIELAIDTVNEKTIEASAMMFLHIRKRGWLSKSYRLRPNAAVIKTILWKFVRENCPVSNFLALWKKMEKRLHDMKKDCRDALG